MSKRDKVWWAFVQVALIFGVFVVLSGIIYAITEYLKGQYFGLDTAILFTITVFLGSAAYDLCKTLGKMELEMVPKVIKGLTILVANIVVFFLVFLAVSWMTNSDSIEIRSWGWGFMIVVVIYEIYLLLTFDKSTTSLTKSLYAGGFNKSFDEIKTQLEEEYILKKVKNSKT